MTLHAFIKIFQGGKLGLSQNSSFATLRAHAEVDIDDILVLTSQTDSLRDALHFSRRNRYSISHGFGCLL